jgi:hypothetical protein
MQAVASQHRFFGVNNGKAKRGLKRTERSPQFNDFLLLEKQKEVAWIGGRHLFT